MQLSFLSFLVPNKANPATEAEPPKPESTPVKDARAVRVEPKKIPPPKPIPTRFLSTGLPVVVEDSPRAKRASGRIKENTAVITLPMHWAKRVKQHAVDELMIKLSHVHVKQQRFLSTMEALQDEDFANGAETLSIQTLAELTLYVHSLNASTFKAPLKGVRMGRSKVSHLAQVNLRTGVMTVSCYCLGEAIPAEAFRYLILHELAHFQEANHSKRFWALVARYCPDYKRQRQLMRLYFQKSQG
jgi:hypothetical protein